MSNFGKVIRDLNSLWEELHSERGPGKISLETSFYGWFGYKELRNLMAAYRLRDRQLTAALKVLDRLSWELSSINFPVRNTLNEIQIMENEFEGSI